MTSRNIAEVAKFDDLVIYTALCACGSSEHNQQLIVELDKNTKNLSLILCQDVCCQESFNDKFLKRIFRRIIRSCKYLFTGKLKLQSEFIFNGEEACRDYAQAILKAADELKVSNLR